MAPREAAGAEQCRRDRGATARRAGPDRRQAHRAASSAVRRWSRRGVLRGRHTELPSEGAPSVRRRRLPLTRTCGAGGRAPSCAACDAARSASPRRTPCLRPARGSRLTCHRFITWVRDPAIANARRRSSTPSPMYSTPMNWALSLTSTNNDHHALKRAHEDDRIRDARHRLSPIDLCLDHAPLEH
jgi:hypothetical protein